MTHLINQLQFEVQCPGEEQAFQLRHSFPDTLQEQISKVVDEVCSALVPADEWIRIDSIVIDTGSFSSDSLYTDFRIIFRKKFEEELEKVIAARPRAEKEFSRQSSLLESFCFFLETGTLPWWASAEDYDPDKICREIMLSQPDEFVNFLYSKQFRQEIWTRMAFQLRPEIKSRIITSFSILAGAREQLLKLAKRIRESIVVEQGEFMANDPFAFDSALIAKAPLLFRATENNIGNIIRRLFTDHVKIAIPPEIPGDIENVITIPDIMPEENDLRRSIFSRNETETSWNTTKPESSGEEQSDRYTIREAGIILSAPFLQQFFTRLRLYGPAGWAGREAAWRAVHLIKFLATGQQQQPEFAMVLEKLICGLPLEEPIPLNIILADQEIDEAISLLDSLREHWKALRNTSLDGLRETFFKRDGLLTRRENDWLLQVERKTLDVLLDSLPWGFSAVRLPWNNYIIYTEW